MLKSYIKIKDITTKTVEDLLKFKLDEKPINQVNDITKINNHKIKSTNNTIEKNEKQIKDIKSISSLFDNLFKTKVICIFNEIYIINKKKEIDLSICGINGIKIDLDENYQTFDMIKKKYKDNEKKLKIFERIIKDKFIEPQKTKVKFKIEKKNNKYL
jgi:hypothetical protein